MSLHGFYGAYNCHVLVRQVLGFVTFSFSAYGVHAVSSTTEIRGSEKPPNKTRGPPRYGVASRMPNAYRVFRYAISNLFYFH